jgi:hypothetical protein
MQSAKKAFIGANSEEFELVHMV